jgi:hypothetical protein
MYQLEMTDSTMSREKEDVPPIKVEAEAEDDRDLKEQL